jgi:hypothetical protein
MSSRGGKSLVLDKPVSSIRSNRREKGQRGKYGMYQMLQAPVQHVCLKTITTAVASAASPHIIKRWNPNSAYTPETGGGSGATPGYADWAALYGYYRVRAYQVKISISNNEAFPVVAYIVHSNNDPTTTNNSTIASNRNCFVKQLAAKGGIDSWTSESPIYGIDYIVGSKAPAFDDLYSALVNASPSDITWMGVGVQSIGGANVTNGISITVEMKQFVDFYDPLQQI